MKNIFEDIDDFFDDEDVEVVSSSDSDNVNDDSKLITGEYKFVSQVQKQGSVIMNGWSQEDKDNPDKIRAAVRKILIKEQKLFDNVIDYLDFIEDYKITFVLQKRKQNLFNDNSEKEYYDPSQIDEIVEQFVGEFMENELYGVVISRVINFIPKKNCSFKNFFKSISKIWKYYFFPTGIDTFYFEINEEKLRILFSYNKLTSWPNDILKIYSKLYNVPIENTHKTDREKVEIDGYDTDWVNNMTKKTASKVPYSRCSKIVRFLIYLFKKRDEAIYNGFKVEPFGYYRVTDNTYVSSSEIYINLYVTNEDESMMNIPDICDMLINLIIKRIERMGEKFTQPDVEYYFGIKSNQDIDLSVMKKNKLMFGKDSENGNKYYVFTGDWTYINDIQHTAKRQTWPYLQTA